MTKRMLIDATHPEETRVALISGNRLEEYDYETTVRKQLKGNIYLVKVTRVEPSLQAAFVDFGGNRHGFLPFPEIHPDYYRIPIADREALIAEERALAAEQAAREDEEDAAELAASGQTLEDLDDEEEEGEDEEEGDEKSAADAEDYVPKHTGSIAEDIAQDSVTEADDEDDEEEEKGEDGEDEEEDTPAPGEQPVGATNAVPVAAETAETVETAEAAPEKDPDVETVGGDAVEAHVYRSSIKRRYKIQEVIKRNQIMLIQISKEERGNKGAAVTSYISLPGRYCVLMPNSPRGGGVSRKVSNAKDRQRLKKILHELNVPEGMSVILRTAGVARTKAEIKRDLDYLLRLWDQIRELTLKSTAPALIYEEGNLIKRAIRDLYRRDIDEVHVAGQVGFETARDFMKTLMPSHAGRIQQYTDPTIPMFYRYQVETQIDEIHSPTVHLKAGGYIVINPTEAMVSIDVNSGKATKGRHIEETALKTNLEASDEIARQLRLRDQGGLIVIDFIDMEDKRNNRIVERRLRDAMQTDRARIQLGRISAFGLLELSRQRLHPSLVETNFEVCKHCNGSGLIRTVETTAVLILRAIEEEGLKGRASEIKVNVPTELALYIFNSKREMLGEIEKRHKIRVFIHADEDLLKPAFNIEVMKSSGVQRDTRPQRPAPVQTVDMSDLPELTGDDISDDRTVSEDDSDEDGRPARIYVDSDGDSGGEHRGGRDRHRGGRDRGGRGGDHRHSSGGGEHRHSGGNEGGGGEHHAHGGGERPAGSGEDDADGRGRRRGRRGGRRRGGKGRDRNFGGRHEGGGEHRPQHAEGQQPEGGFSDPGAGPQPDLGGAPVGSGEQQQGQREHRQGGEHGGRDRHRGGRNRNRGGRDRNHGGNRHQNGHQNGQRPEQGAGGEGGGEGGQPQHQHGGHSHEQAPRREEQSPRAPEQHQSHEAAQDNGDDGKARKGWWKRLTE